MTTSINTDIADNIIRTQMRKRNTPGVAISVLKNGQAIYSKGFGSRNLKQFQPMDADTLMGVGSISKSFTAFAVMKLQEMGKLSIDDSVAKYLKVEPFLSRPEITLKHLLSHRSGIPSLDAGMLGFHYAFDDFSSIYPATSRADFLAHLADASEFIVFKPGERFYYNNDMYSCLSFIIEQQAGMSFTQFVQQEILDPLAMTRAVYTQQGLDEDPDNNVMTGYRFSSDSGKRAAKESDLPIGGYFPPRGGLYASMNNMLNYAQCLLNRGEYNGKQLLSSASVDSLFTGLISMPYGEGNDPQYALGWCIESPSEQTPYTVIQHAGGMGTSQSFLLLVPELQLAAVAAENASTGITPLAARTMLALAMDQVPEKVIDELRISKVLDDVLGTYKSAYDLYEFKLSLQSNVLQADVKTDDGTFSFPVLINDLASLSFKAYSMNMGDPNNRGKIQFHRNKDSQRIEFVSYDRYLYRRI